MPFPNYYISSLPILPEGWPTRTDIKFLDGPSYYVSASKTRTEEWRIAFLIADGHHVAYRFKFGESFGYGG